MASPAIRQFRRRVARGERLVGHTDMAPHSVLLVVVLLGLAMAPADGQSLEFDQSIKANLSTGSGSGSGSNKQANVGGMVPGSREGLPQAVRRLLTMKGLRFFQRLSQVFPSTAKLLDAFIWPSKFSPISANKMLSDFSALLKKRVQQREISKQQADLLLDKTVKEVKVRPVPHRG